MRLVIPGQDRHSDPNHQTHHATVLRRQSRGSYRASKTCEEQARNRIQPSFADDTHGQGDQCDREQGVGGDGGPFGTCVFDLTRKIKPGEQKKAGRENPKGKKWFATFRGVDAQQWRPPAMKTPGFGLRSGGTA
jgi:hypothetical protein